MRVLYIDDDRLNTLLFSETCRAAGGVELECADSGAEALALIAQWAPQALVIDLHLPDTDGWALLPVLRARLPQPLLAAWLCTAEDCDAIAVQTREAGFDGCWTKPVSLATVRAVLSGIGSGRPAPA